MKNELTKKELEEFAQKLEQEMCRSGNYKVRISDDARSVCILNSDYDKTQYGIRSDDIAEAYKKAQEEVVSKIAKQFLSLIPKNNGMDFGPNADNLFLCVMPYDEKKLCDTVHEKFLDMAVVLRQRFYMDKEGFSSSVIFKQTALSFYPDMTEQELLKRAYENTKKMYSFRLNYMDGIPILMDGISRYSANAILFPEVMEEMKKEMNGPFYIIPSSVHELILLPQNCGLSIREMTSMIRNVNDVAVKEPDILSDHLYLYKDSKIHMV